jgi:hypothetical protein
MALFVLCAGVDPALAAEKDRKTRKQRKAEAADPYAEYVWPPPPDTARIKLERVIRGRADVEPRSGFARKLLGASPQSPYDLLVKPFAVEFDREGRVLVTDSGTSALIRFDVDERRMDVLGTRGNVRLSLPLGMDVAPDGTIYVADAGLKAVVAFDPEGRVLRVIGSQGELVNPTDAALSPDGSRLYVTDSKAHQVVIFDAASARKLSTVGTPGDGDGQFAFPTSLTFGPEGDLFVVDQINARVQVFSEDGEYLDQLGGLGVGFGDFVRPKDVAVDEVGFIYVTDNAFNNVQLFDTDFTLLTFIGSGGVTPGTFNGASGIAVQGDRFAVVDQLGRRVQLFRFLLPKDADPGDPAASVVASRERQSPEGSPPSEEEAPEPAVAVIPEAPATPEPQPEVPAVSETPPTPQRAVEPPARAEPSTPQRAAPPETTTADAGEESTVSEKVTPEASSRVVAKALLASQIGDLVRGWAAAWSGQRVDEYLAYYAEGFTPATGASHDAWVDQRRRRISAPTFIEVTAEGLVVEEVGSGRVRVSFAQTYRSNTFQDRVVKTLELERKDAAWRIVAERAGGL